MTLDVRAGEGLDAEYHADSSAAWSAAKVIRVVGELARRNLYAMLRIPGTVIPVVVMPIFLVLAFSGAFGALDRLPGYPAPDILDWMVPYAIVQGSAFAGLGAAFSAGRDLEGGFFDRLLVSPSPRFALVAGPVVYSALRPLLPMAIVLPLGLLGGARLRGGLLGFASLVVASVGTAVAAALWGLGVVYRTRTQRSGGLVQVGILLTLFLSTVQVPLDLMTGWLHAVARVNPMTNVLRLAREGFLGPVTWDQTWGGLVALACGWILLGWFAWRGLKQLEIGKS
ncbi:MAG: hypothetical protein KatS3mg008_1900 [Acidimicrobiales bacterium]|nr:MAG: hypothetical protein KatS3mg008_1900 [Acidimicrobiales bacterium]